MASSLNDLFDSELLDFCTRIMRATADGICPDLYWNISDEDDALYFEVCTSDVFHWAAGGEGVEVTPENLSILEECCEIARQEKAKGNYRFRAGILFAARVMGMRPQGCVYDVFAPECWHLLDTCGPERPIDEHNPYRPGERAAKLKQREAPCH